LVRLLLERQLGYPLLANLLKSVYVEVAERDLVIRGRTQTDSRISLLTGIHRKDVKRLRRELADGGSTPPTRSLGALLVSRWLAEPDFQDEDARPRPLPRRSAALGGASFESLVASVSKDIPARSVLDEWLRLGVVVVDADDRVRLRANSFVPEHGLDEKLHFFGRNLRDHIAAGAHNLLKKGRPFLDRSVYYDRLSAESAEELARLAHEAGSELLLRLNQRARELQTRDADAVAANHRMTFGTYFYSADELAESAGELADTPEGGTGGAGSGSRDDDLV
jgi:hypothetical protein